MIKFYGASCLQQGGKTQLDVAVQTITARYFNFSIELSPEDDQAQVASKLRQLAHYIENFEEES